MSMPVIFSERAASVRAAQVRAAITMLVLLGVPWVFTAFGALKTGDGTMDTIQLIGQVPTHNPYSPFYTGMLRHIGLTLKQKAGNSAWIYIYTSI